MHSKLRIGIDNTLHQSTGFCQWLRELTSTHRQDVEVELVLFCHNSLSLVAAVEEFLQIEVVFDQVFHASDEQFVELIAAMPLDVLFVADAESNLSRLVNKVGVSACYPMQWKPKQEKRLVMHWVFDADAVLFSHDSDTEHEQNGLQHFEAHEFRHRHTPLRSGPLRKLIEKIDRIQRHSNSIKWSLLTARGGRAMFRVLTTLNRWNLKPKDMFFMSGEAKSKVLKSLNSQIFFDDNLNNCVDAQPHVLTVHVPKSLKPNENNETGFHQTLEKIRHVS